MSGHIDRLPKWAQEEIAILRAKVERAEKIIATMHGSEGRVTMGYAHSGPAAALPHDQPFTFTMSRDGHPKESVNVSLLQDLGDWHLRISGSDSIVVMPMSSNLVNIQMRDRGGAK